MPLDPSAASPPSPPQREPAAATRAPLLTLVAASIAGFLGTLMGSAVNVALPAIGASLAADAVTLSWVVTSFLLVSAALLLPLGSLADRIGRRRLFVLGLAIMIAAGIGSAFAPSASLLIVFRALTGVGGALQFSTSTALVVAVTPPARRGAALGIAVASVYVGLAVGPFVGGILTEALGWRSVFLLPALLTLPALVLVWLGVPDDARPGGSRDFDRLGAIIYAVALASLLFASSRLTSLLGLALAAGGVLGIGLFLWLQYRLPHPLLDLRRVLANRVFVLSNLAAMIHYAATFAVGYFLSLYLQSVRGLGPRAAGLLLVVQPLFMAALSPLAGRLSDRIEARWLASGGMLLTTIGLGLLARVDAATPFAAVVFGLVLLGLGFALFSSPNTNAVLSAVSHAELGLANATLATMRNVGQALSMALALLLVSHHVGAQALGPATAAGLTAAMRGAFALFALAAALGALASLARGSRAGAAPPRDRPAVGG